MIDYAETDFMVTLSKEQVMIYNRIKFCYEVENMVKCRKLVDKAFEVFFSLSSETRFRLRVIDNSSKEEQD